MHIHFVTGLQNRRLSFQKIINFSLKMFFLKICFRDEDHLYVNSSFYTLTVYAKCLLFQFFSRGIRMHISILTGVQNGRISLERDNHIFLKNVSFESFFPR